MPVLHSPESEFAKEMVKWEAYPTLLGPGLRPYLKHDFPMAVYRAERLDGKLRIAESLTVESEGQLATARARGFSPTPTDAYAGITAAELEIATLAANRAFHEQRMSPQARAAVAAVEADTAGHLPSMPVTPIKRRGRPPTKIAEGV